MARHDTSRKIFGEYTKYITDVVLDEFGGSYANRQEYRNTWRVRFPYAAECEAFIMQKSRTFLRTLPDCNLRDLNFSYSLCQNIADYLSKYMAKKTENNGKSKNKNKESMKQYLLKELFFDFPVFVANFKKRYKKPLDMANDDWVNANPGVVVMAKYLGKNAAPDVVANVPVKKRRPRIGRVNIAEYIAGQNRQK